MATILIADDEKNICELLTVYAEHNGYTALTARDGIEAISQCENNEVDLVILDIAMPGLNGVAAFKEIKSRWGIPIIILSAYGEEYGKLFAFDMGVDDYVVKPFSPRELMARVKAILSRTIKAPISRQTITTGELTIDFDAHNVILSGVSVALTPTEYRLLCRLAEDCGQVVERRVLISELWGGDGLYLSRTLDSHIKSLRKKLGVNRKLIETVRGQGYRLLNVPNKSAAS